MQHWVSRKVCHLSVRQAFRDLDDVVLAIDFLAFLVQHNLVLFVDCLVLVLVRVLFPAETLMLILILILIVIVMLALILLGLKSATAAENRGRVLGGTDWGLGQRQPQERRETQFR